MGVSYLERKQVKIYNLVSLETLLAMDMKIHF